MAKGPGESLKEKTKLFVDIQGKSPVGLMYDPDPALEIASKYDRRLAEIDGDPNLSPIGVSNSKNKAAVETYGKISAWGEKHIGVMTQRIDDGINRLLKRTVRPTPADSSAATLIELRRQEIRRQFEGLDALSIEAVFLNADQEVRDALASGPPILRREKGKVPQLEPMVKPELVSSTLMGEAENEDPKAVTEIRKFEVIRGQYEGITNFIKSELRKVTSINLEGDPLAEVVAPAKGVPVIG